MQQIRGKNIITAGNITQRLIYVMKNQASEKIYIFSVNYGS